MKELVSCIGFQLKLTKNIMENEHNIYLKKFGISSEQGLLLKLVYEMPGCTQTQISEVLHKDKTTITRMIDCLVKKDALVRKNSEEDRRVYKIYVTKKTANNIEELAPIFEKREKELREIVDEKDYETTLRVLNQIKEYYRGLNK
ncbi:MarR family winged helix-turn-helix transcriptional regulator [Sulfurospirillum arcachonense]|uniref:MarR family winged helix-turn-helix transcriptional regulator n=1 Tax=Sulfurospirillum arcachonense TaxID=57666 RepID=UPI000469D7F6|nr:MarR family transcriptional regulator [Sulfurospirillum arcachonense]